MTNKRSIPWTQLWKKLTETVASLKMVVERFRVEKSSSLEKTLRSRKPLVTKFARGASTVTKPGAPSPSFTHSLLSHDAAPSSPSHACLNTLQTEGPTRRLPHSFLPLFINLSDQLSTLHKTSTSSHQTLKSFSFKVISTTFTTHLPSTTKQRPT